MLTETPYGLYLYAKMKMQAYEKQAMRAQLLRDAAPPRRSRQALARALYGLAVWLEPELPSALPHHISASNRPSLS